MEEGVVKYIPAPKTTTRSKTVTIFVILSISISISLFLFLCVQIVDLKSQIEELTLENEYQLDRIMMFEKYENSNPCYLEKNQGPCKASISRWFYNSNNQQCEQFVYGGCEGNPNNFVTFSQCQKVCMKDSIGVENKENTIQSKLTTNQTTCSLQPSSGPCKAKMPRYYFDKNDKICKKFYYGGCAGNSNNFLTIDDCEIGCKERRRSEVDICLMPKEIGNCRAAIPRWYFDSKEKLCKKFTWGGCFSGNDKENNFATKEKCENSCRKFANFINESEIIEDVSQIDLSEDYDDKEFYEFIDDKTN